MLLKVTNIPYFIQHVTKKSFSFPSQLMKALHQLQNDQNIIKPADKGGATVVLNKQDYKDKVLHILSDKMLYDK